MFFSVCTRGGIYLCICECKSGCAFKTHSVVEGEERSVAMLPCLLSCCSLGEDGSESVISSISSWADWDLVFFLLNACLKELRNCKTNNTKTNKAKGVNIATHRPQQSQHVSSGDITSCQIRKSRRAVSKQWSLSGLR